MTINVNQRVTPLGPAAEAADTSLSLNDALRQKKKKCRYLDLLETLVLPQLPQSAPQLDASIAKPAVSQEQSPAPCQTVNPVGEASQTSRLPTQFTHGTSVTSSSAAQPHPWATGASLARQQPTLVLGTPRAVSNAAEGRVAAPVARHAAVAITPQQPVLAVKAEQAAVAASALRHKLPRTAVAASALRHKLPRTAVAASALRHKLPRTAEEGTAQAGAAPQALLPTSGSGSVVTAEDAWFTTQATPINPPTEQVEDAGGMKLSYQFLRWGGGQVDISAQPNQLLFQPSTEMVRDRLGESLLARPQAQAWHMDEQPDRRQPQQHRQNDEEEC